MGDGNDREKEAQGSKKNHKKVLQGKRKWRTDEMC